MSETPQTCELCDATFFYDPKHHKCPDVWEAEAGPIEQPEMLTWDEECVRKAMNP